MRGLRVAAATACAALVVSIVALGLRSGAPPERLWAHPGDPWCARCASGVPRFTFRRSPDGPEYDPAWCFGRGDDGFYVGAPEGLFERLFHEIEQDTHCGERSYPGGVAYTPTGVHADAEGHAWTEYRRVER